MIFQEVFRIQYICEEGKGTKVAHLGGNGAVGGITRKHPGRIFGDEGTQVGQVFHKSVPALEGDERIGKHAIFVVDKLVDFTRQKVGPVVIELDTVHCFLQGRRWFGQVELFIIISILSARLSHAATFGGKDFAKGLNGVPRSFDNRVELIVTFFILLFCFLGMGGSHQHSLIQDDQPLRVVFGSNERPTRCRKE